MKMSALLSRNASSRPGITGTARVDRDIDRLLRRIAPGDIVVIDALDLDRITADALVEAGVTAVVNASPSISGRYPNLGPEVLVANGITLIDDTGDDVFKKVKDGARVRLHEGGVYSGDRRLALGAERTDLEIHELMHEAKSGLVAHLEAFAGNTIEFIRSESPLLIDGIGIPDIDVDMNRRHVVIVAEEDSAAADENPFSFDNDDDEDTREKPAGDTASDDENPFSFDDDEDEEKTPVKETAKDETPDDENPFSFDDEPEPEPESEPEKPKKKGLFFWRR